MYKTFATIAVATGTFFVLEGCKSDAANDETSEPKTRIDDITKAVDDITKEFEKGTALLFDMTFYDLSDVYDGNKCADIADKTLAKAKTLLEKLTQDAKENPLTEAEKLAFGNLQHKMKAAGYRMDQAYNTCVHASKSSPEEKARLRNKY